MLLGFNFPLRRRLVSHQLVTPLPVTHMYKLTHLLERKLFKLPEGNKKRLELRKNA